MPFLRRTQRAIAHLQRWQLHVLIVIMPTASSKAGAVQLGETRHENMKIVAPRTTTQFARHRFVQNTCCVARAGPHYERVVARTFKHLSTAVLSFFFKRTLRLRHQLRWGAHLGLLQPGPSLLSGALTCLHGRGVASARQAPT